MCRSIKPLFNFNPPATDDELHAAALQFVRKISGMQQPSHANEAAFTEATDAITAAAKALIASLSTTARAKTHEEEAAKARARWAQRQM
jgi:hypothetical protein